MIIWIINQYNMPPELGHLNRHYNLGKYLKRLGHEPIVFVGSKLHNSNIQMITDKTDYKIYKESDFKYVFIRTCDYINSKLKRVIAMFEFYFRVMKVSKKFEKPDVIIGSSAHPLACIAAIKLGKKYNCQVIAEVRDLWPESIVAYGMFKKSNPLMKILYNFEKWIYKKVDKIIFTMEGGKDYVIEKKWDLTHGGKIDINKIYHLNNGIDLEEFNNNKENFIIADSDFINDNFFKVVYTGSIRLVNKINKIIDVAKLLSKYNIHFYLWGSGNQVDDIKEKVKLENLDNVFLKGNIDKKYVPYITSLADLNIIFGDSIALFKYGISMNKMFDYFAACKPSLLTFKTGYSLVEKYKAGLEVEKNEARNIADSILFFKNMDKEKYDEYCNNALKAAEDYDFKNLSLLLIKIIES